MVQINFAQKQVNAKIVYYGPGMSGKTTNLEVVHQRAPEQNKGELTSISTDGDRTLFFDFMPLDLGTVAGMRTCFQIYTVPGQVYYNSTRKLVLQGVDGVVFVADSSASMSQENLDSLRNLEENLNEYGKSLSTLPHVIQFNKRDLPDAMPVEELNAMMNPHHAPCFEAIANTGQGVFPTLKALAARVLETIHQQSGGSAAPRPQSAAGARVVPPMQPGPQIQFGGPPQVGGPQPGGRPGFDPQPILPGAARPAVPMGAPAIGQYPQYPTPQQAGHPGAMPGVDAYPAANYQHAMGAGQPSMPQVAPAVAPPPMQANVLMQSPYGHPPGAPQGVPQGYVAAPPPAMNAAGILTQTGFHSGAIQAPPATYYAPAQQQVAPQQQQMASAQHQMAPHQQQQPAPAANLHLATRAPVGGAGASPAPRTEGPRGGSRAPRQQTPAAGPKAAASSKATSARKQLEGTRFRPRAAARLEARPTPVVKASSKLYTGLFVGLALAVGAVLTRVILSFF
jgi:mutual gliding-motility protein MglA